MHDHQQRARDGASSASSSVDSAGAGLRTASLPGRPLTDDERTSDAATRADESVRLLDQLAEQLADAIIARDFDRARNASATIAAIRPGLAAALADARGTDAGTVADLAQRADAASARLAPLLARAPAAGTQLGDLLGAENDAARAAWLAQLGDGEGAAVPGPAIDAAARAGLGDVSHARLHTDERASAAADAIGARAVTIGPDIHFAADEYQPGTDDGAALFGHELAHVGQQGAAVGIAAKLRTSAPADAAEQEADEAGDTFAAALGGAHVAPVALAATPATVAPDRKKQPRPGMNAAMKVTAYDQDGKPIESWQSRALWQGKLPVQYEGNASGGRWTWDNSGAASVMVNTTENGSGGRPVQAWATSKKAARVVVHVIGIDDVTQLDALDLSDLRDPKARGKFVQGSDALGHALPEEHAGDGSTETVKPDAKPDAKRTRDGDGGGGDSTRADARERADGIRSDGPHAEPGADTGTGTGAEHRDGADTDVSLDGLDSDDEAESEQFDAALDEEIAQLLADLGEDDTEDGDGGDGTKPGGTADGRTGDDTSAEGTGPGGDKAKPGGGTKSHGTNEKGLDDEGESTRGGQTEHAGGKVGGEDGGKKGGVRGGGTFALFGFTIAIPESLVGAVEVGLIVNDGNVTGFGAATVSKAAREATEQLARRGGTAAARSALKRQANEAVAQRMRAFRKELSTAMNAPEKELTRRQRQLRKHWGKLSAADKQSAMRVTAWELQRRYFDETLKAARKEASKLRRSVRRTRDLGKRAELRDKLASVEQLADAASVKPVAGRLPIGHRYAGKEFPRDQLPPEYRAKGLQINADGFPEFEPHAFTLPNGKKSIHVELTGGRTPDERIANELADLDEMPPYHTWHHDAITGDMMLVPTDLHDAVRHTGNAAVWRHAHGAEQYGK